MTNDEQKMLRDLYRAFLEVPPGSPKGKRPLIEDIHAVVNAYNSGRWAARFIIYALPTVAGVGIAIQQIREFFIK